MNKVFNKKFLYTGFLGVIFLRVLLFFLPSFHIDMVAWQAWAARLLELGPNNFYSDKVWTNYTPGYLLILWGLSFFNKIIFNYPFFSQNFEILIKLLNTFFDFGSAFLIYKIIRRNLNIKIALLASLLYLSNIASIFNTSVWGQIDGLLTLLLLSSIWFILENKNLSLSLASITLAYLIKPQAIALIPIYIILVITKFNIRKIFYAIPFSLVLMTIFTILFFPRNLFLGLINLSIQMTKDYSYTSLFAFNFWSLIGFWQNDLKTFLGINYQIWGFLVYIVSLIFITLNLIKSKFQDRSNIYLSISLSLMAFYLFPTRIHERYLLPFFAFFLIAAFLKKSYKLILLYFFLSIIHFSNLYYVYIYYNDLYNNPSAISPLLYNFISLLYPIFAILTIISFGVILFTQYKNVKLNMLGKLLDLKILKKPNFWLSLILVFALFSRGFRVWYPNKYVFDEVYHAFTSKEYLKGSREAWEWWTTPPPGVAFEWTHPPLAKEAMTASMYIFQTTDAWAYRLPGIIVGTISIYLLYLLVLTLSKNKPIALFSAFIFSIDGLNFVQSRTGMNDIYVVTAIIASLVFFFNKKMFWSAVFVGLALASKWTGFYAIGLIYLIKIFQEYNGKKLFQLAVNLTLIITSLVLLLFPLIVASQTKNLPLTIFNNEFSNLDSFSNLYAPIQLLGLLLLSIVMVFLPKFRSWGVFLLLPSLIYIASYIPFFLLGHDYKTFISLQQQMWWYHTGLKAHHDYSSPWWSWPLNLYPVWYFVDYHKDTISNIFASGNPGVFWIGVVALLLTLKELVTSFLKKNLNNSKVIFIAMLGFFVFWLPWALSPRIMFLYHFSPSVPFLSIVLGYQINSLWIQKNQKIWVIVILFYLLISFLLIYPMLTGIPLPRNLMLLFFTTNLTKNPFGS